MLKGDAANEKLANATGNKGLRGIKTLNSEKFMKLFFCKHAV